MGSFRSRAFDALDLKIIDRVYEAAWAQLEAREPKDGERGEALRQRIFAVASSGKVDLDSLCDREPWTVFREDGCSGEVSA